MTDLIYDVLAWYLTASGLFSALVLVLCAIGWACRRRHHPKHHQPIYGPFRPNVRKIL